MERESIRSGSSLTVRISPNTVGIHWEEEGIHVRPVGCCSCVVGGECGKFRQRYGGENKITGSTYVDFRPVWLDLIVRAINGTAASLVQRVLEQQDQTRFAQREGRHFCAPELHQPFRNRISRWRNRSFGCPVVRTPTYGSSN